MAGHGQGCAGGWRRWRRWRGRRGRRRGHRVPTVARAGGPCGEPVVQCPPVARPGVLPGLVAGKGGFVVQRRCGRLGVSGIRSKGLCPALGQRKRGQAQRCSACHADQSVVHRWKPGGSTARRCRSRETPAAPAKRTHGPRATSPGGREGSEGSGRSVLPARDEIRRGCGRFEEPDQGEPEGFGQADRRAQQGREGAEGRAHVALVSARRRVTRGVVAGVTACVFMGRRVLAGRQVVQGPVGHGRMGSRLSGHGAALHGRLALHAHAARRAHHGCRHCTPQGKQQGQEQDEPETNRFHGGPEGCKALHHRFSEVS